MTLETKADSPASTAIQWDPQSTELRDAFGDFLSAFEHFKDANDDRLSQIEKRVSADVVTADKVERINTAMDEQKLFAPLEQE